MTQIAKALANKALQSNFHCAMDHCQRFQIEENLPDFLLEKLDCTTVAKITP